MTRGDVNRWLYRGQRPNWIARTLNRVWAAVASTGVTSNLMETLEVTGRKSGRTVSLPIVVAVVNGQRYLQRVPGARPHIPVDMDAPIADFEKVAADFPVFQVFSQKKV